MKNLLILITLIISFISKAQQHTFTSFSPNNAATGEVVTLRGTNFTGVTAVRFGGTNAASFTVINSTTIVATVASGSSGNITVLKTGFTTRSLGGFNYSIYPTITSIITDFGGIWNTNSTTTNSTLPNEQHNLLSFTYKGFTYSTGVNDGVLTSNSISFSPQDYRGLPVTLTGNTNTSVTDNGGNPQYIIASSKIDGNQSSAVYTNVNIKDLTPQSVLTDGLKGLGLGTGYTNLKTGSTSNYNVRFINPGGISDDIPDIIVTQIAEPTGVTIDTYTFLDDNGNVVGQSISGIDLNRVSTLGSYECDLFGLPLNTPNSSAKPNSNITSKTTRPIRFLAFRLSDFNINNSNYTQVSKLRITASGTSDVAFVGYNAETIYSLPIVTINSSSDSVYCSGEFPYLKIDVVAPGETLTYQWEVSNNDGLSWSNLSGYNSIDIYPPTPIYGQKYRCKVTTANGYFTYSPLFTLDGCLPVTLISFTGQCLDNGNNLIWKTASEHNSDYFELYSSRDGENWLVVNKQNAAGNSVGELIYNYIDTNTNSNIIYYRLLQVDIDNVQKNYGPISVECEINDISVNTYPNPSDDSFYISLQTPKPLEKCLINIFNMNGELMMVVKIFDVEKGNNIYNIENLSKGVYLIKIETDNLIINLKQIKN